MKKFVYYLLLIVSAIILWIVFGCLFALVVGPSYNYAYAVGARAVQPYTILLAIGFALLLRKPLSSALFGTGSNIKNRVAFIIIGVAVALAVWMIGVEMHNASLNREVLEMYLQQNP